MSQKENNGIQVIVSGMSNTGKTALIAFLMNYFEDTVEVGYENPDNTDQYLEVAGSHVKTILKSSCSRIDFLESVSNGSRVHRVVYNPKKKSHA